MLTHAPEGAEEMNGTSRSRKRSATMTSHTKVTGTGGGRGWGSQMNNATELLLPGGTAQWVEKQQQHWVGSCGRACAIVTVLYSWCPLLC